MNSYYKTKQHFLENRRYISLRARYLATVNTFSKTLHSIWTFSKHSHMDDMPTCPSSSRKILLPLWHHTCRYQKVHNLPLPMILPGCFRCIAVRKMRSLSKNHTINLQILVENKVLSNKKIGIHKNFAKSIKNFSHHVLFMFLKALPYPISVILNFMLSHLSLSQHLSSIAESKHQHQSKLILP